MVKYFFIDLISKIKSFFIKISNLEIYLICESTSKTNTFRDIILSKEYKSKKEKLCKNLDKGSQKVLRRFFKRAEAFVFKNKKYFIKSFDEYFNIKIAQFHKNKTVKQCGPNWQYDDFIISQKQFNNMIFWDKYFINKFSNLDKIKESDILDVGGFIGDSAVLFEKYTNKKVRVFEPVESNYIDLLKTIEANKTDKIVPYKFGLSNREDELLIDIPKNSAMSATRRIDKQINGGKKELIKIRRLDDIVKEENLKIGLIKVDIEGVEQDFLDGARQTIISQRPNMLIAIYHSGDDFFDIKEKIEAMNLGYKFQIAKVTKNCILDDTILICEAR